MNELEVVQEVFGATSMEQAADVADSLDGILAAAFEAANILYHPDFGEHDAAGTLSPREAVVAVLTDVMRAAPSYPAWASLGQSDSPSVFDLNDCVSDIVDGVLLVINDLGWTDIEEEGVTDEVIEQGRDVIQRLIDTAGYLTN